MKFLADESCDHLFIRGLRDQDYDVVSIAETNPGLEDEEVAERALTENRLLMTEDRDFSHYIFARVEQQVGVLFFRYPFSARNHIFERTLKLLRSEEENLQGKFIVIKPGKTRIRKLP
jgi:predicted nuclease of predicted toxin-antitoxin system